MIRRDVCSLISETPGAHGVHDTHTQTPRQVYCEVRSIGMKLLSEAKAAGMSPDVRLRLAREELYQGEKLCLFHGEMYDVESVYPLEQTNGIDLMLRRQTGNGLPLAAASGTEASTPDAGESGSDTGAATETVTVTGTDETGGDVGV